MRDVSFAILRGPGFRRLVGVGVLLGALACDLNASGTKREGSAGAGGATSAATTVTSGDAAGSGGATGAGGSAGEGGVAGAGGSAGEGGAAGAGGSAGEGGAAGAGGSGPILGCGGVECASGQICCVESQGDPTQQTCALASACSDVIVECDGPEDCPGEHCCGDYNDATGEYRSVRCQASCDDDEAIICHFPSGWCPPSFACIDSSALPAGFGWCY